MRTFYLTFMPDDHYGYPEIGHINESITIPPSYDDTMKQWTYASYSAEIPDEELFLEYGKSDLYGNLYIINGYATKESILEYIKGAFYEFDPEGTETEYNFMITLSSNSDIESILAYPTWSGKEITMYYRGKKEAIHSNNFNINDINNSMSDIIIDKINSGDFQKASKVFISFNRNPMIEDVIKSKISDSDYSKFKSTLKGVSISRRFDMD